MCLYEYSSAYRQAEEDRFGDVDSENTTVLEMCIVSAEEFLCELLPEDVDFQVLKEGLVKFYDSFLAEYYSLYYWDMYSVWAKAQSDY